MPKKVKTTPAPLLFQLFLRFNYGNTPLHEALGMRDVSTLLEILHGYASTTYDASGRTWLFQPFLRF